MVVVEGGACSGSHGVVPHARGPPAVSGGTTCHPTHVCRSRDDLLGQAATGEEGFASAAEVAEVFTEFSIGEDD